MPSGTEFRVGDRVETRRLGSIPAEQRQLRAEVTGMLSIGNENQYRLRFTNPVTTERGFDIHYHRSERRWWKADELRLVSRKLRLTSRATVLVSPSGPPSLAGLTTTVIGPDALASSWLVADANGRPQGVDESNLTVIEEAPPLDLSSGDLVYVPSQAWTAAVPSEGLQVRSVAQQVCRVNRRLGDDSWEIHPIDAPHSTWEVHGAWLLPLGDTTPRHSVGDLVDIEDGYRMLPKALTPDAPDTSVYSLEGIVLGVEGPLVTVSALGADGDRSPTRIHQDWLSTVEAPSVTEGQTVRILRSAVEVRSGAAYSVPGSMNATVESSTLDRRGNVLLRLPDSSLMRVHWSCLRFYGPDEMPDPLIIGARVRIGEDPDVGRDLWGRIGTLQAEIGNTLHTGIGNQWEVSIENGRGYWYVSAEYLTPLGEPCTDGPRCHGCGCGVTSPSSVYCEECLRECRLCEEPFPITGPRAGEITCRDDGWECRNCVAVCCFCSAVYPTTEMVEDNGGRHYCEDHYGSCEECGEIVYGTQRHCRECGEHTGRDALGHWRRTTPTMWLGGPVRSEGGYYIGFEHEVTAESDFNLRRLREWAAANLGHRSALDPKPDSTVDGFEIATQPMTPAFFEQVDWDSYMEMLAEVTRWDEEEPDGHGLHVHIGRQAFRRPVLVKKDSRGRLYKKPHRVMRTDPGMLAAFTYLLTRGHHHLVRIGRRDNDEWAPTVPRPVAAAIVHEYSGVPHSHPQLLKLQQAGEYIEIPRGAVNLNRPETVEIRVAKSTRDPGELRDAVRVVYLAAEYVRHLRSAGSINPSLVTWEGFSEWVAEVFPEAYASIAGRPLPETRTLTPVVSTLMDAFHTPASEVAPAPNLIQEMPEPEPDLTLVEPMPTARAAVDPTRTSEQVRARIDEQIRVRTSPQRLRFTPISREEW